MRRFTPLFLACALMSLPVATLAPLVAQQKIPELPGKADISRVKAGSYQTDPVHTVVGFSVDHFGFNPYPGLFGDIKGTLVIDPAKPENAKVDITVPLSGLATASSELNTHMRGADFFEAEKYSDVRFVSTAVKVEGITAMIEGNLTIKGVTKPVTLEAEFTGAGKNPMNKKETVGFKGYAMIKRSDFGMGYGIPMVSDTVNLSITVAFEKE